MKKQNIVIILILLLELCTLPIAFVAASASPWVTKEPMPTARSNFGVAVVNGKIYAIGGSGHSSYFWLAVNEEYDPVADKWVEREPMPTSRRSFAISAYKNKIYVMGGIDNGNRETLSANQVYDPASNTWETRTSLPIPLAHVDANVVEDNIYLIGGEVNQVYNPATDSWQIKTPMPTPTLYYASAVINGKIYFIGGSNSGNLTQVYDPKNDSWSSAAPVPRPVQEVAAGATTGVFAQKMIYVIGGTFTQIYNPKTDTWTEGEPMLTNRTNLAVAVVNDILYAIGGRGFSGVGFGYYSRSDNEQYTPTEYRVAQAPQNSSHSNQEDLSSSPTIPEFTPANLLACAVTACFVAFVFRKKSLRK